LKGDAEGPAWTDEHIAASFSVSVPTVQGVRQRLVEQGLEAALTRKKQARPSRAPLLDGAGEARLIALRCSAPPAGHARWTLRLLADQAVALDIVEAISHETVRQTLKKMR
jgi:transposase